MDEFVSRSETEYSRGWAEKNPELFAKSVLRFFEERPAINWSHEIDASRSGFLTFTAKLKA